MSKKKYLTVRIREEIIKFLDDRVKEEQIKGFGANKSAYVEKALYTFFKNRYGIRFLVAVNK